MDLFFLLSGLGCVFSYSNSINFQQFYKKRFLRILPTYILIIIVYGIFCICIVQNIDVYDYVKKYNLISFWQTGNLSEWFIAAICALYIMFPILYILLKSSKFFLSIIWFIVALSIMFSASSYNEVLEVINEIFICRIPAFLVGMLIGKKIKEGEEGDEKKIPPFFYLIFISIIWIINYFMKVKNWMVISRLLFLPWWIFLFPYICKIFNDKKSKLLLLGTITLEIYLIHEKLLGITFYIFSKINCGNFIASVCSNITAILGAIVLGKIIHCIILKVFEICHKIKKLRLIQTKNVKR